MIDVCVYDRVGMPYHWYQTSGLGGSECSALRLAHALHDAGLTVLLNNDPSIPVPECGTLIVERFSPLPESSRKETLIHLHDAPGDRHAHLRGRSDVTLIAQTPAHLAMFELFGTPMELVPPMLPDVVYTSPRPPRIAGTYLYPASPIKGWDATYPMWKALRRPGDILYVLDAGYGRMSPIDDPTVVQLPPLGDKDLVRLIAQVAGLFYVNMFPETFCATVAMANALGTPIFVFTEREPGALTRDRLLGCVTAVPSEFRESFLTREDYRPASVLPKWLSLIGRA